MDWLTCGPVGRSLRRRWITSNGRRASSTCGLLAPASQSSTGRAACSCLSWPALLPRRPNRPTLLQPLARPSLYSPTTPVILRRPLSRLPQLRVIPLLGLASSIALVLSVRHGQRGQRTTSIGSGLYVERLIVGSTAGCKEMPPDYAQNNDFSM